MKFKVKKFEEEDLKLIESVESGNDCLYLNVNGESIVMLFNGHLNIDSGKIKKIGIKLDTNFDLEDIKR